MLGYKKSPASTYKINESGLDTAHKSSHQEFSPSRVNGPAFKYQPHINNRIQEARSTISSIIDEVSGKRNANNEAAQRVKIVNDEALGFYGQNEYNLGNRQTRNSNKLVRPRSNIQFVENDTNFQVSNVVPRNQSLQEENQYLKKTLSQQIEENSVLMKRIRFLEAENDDLRGKLGMIGSKGLGSTNHNSVNYGDVSNNGFKKSTHSPTTAKFQRPSDHHNYHNQQVQPLNFNEPQHHQNNYISKNESRTILDQLNILKTENEILRQEAISLLKTHY